MEEVWRKFTPVAIDPKLCMSRTWSSGKGGQCSKLRAAGSEFCGTHGKGPQVHGRVDGPIPEAKLREFEGAAAAASRSPKERKRKEPGESSPAKALKRQKSEASPNEAPKSSKSEADLLALGAKGLAHFIEQQGWTHDRWSEICRKLQAGAIEVKEAVRHVLQKMQKNEIREAERQKKSENSTENKTSAAQAEQKAADAKSKTPALPRSKVSKPSKMLIPKPPKCTCGCPIHTEKCRLFKTAPPIFKATQSFLPPPQPGAPGVKVMGGNRTPPRPSLPSSAPMPNFKSSWSSKQFRSILDEVDAMSPKNRRSAMKKKMLLYHPDKNSGAPNLEEMTEVYIEVKKRYDKMP